MAVTNTFYDAVKSGSIRKIRIMMKNSLLMDPTFSEFMEMEKAAASVEGLYDKHDGRDFKSDQSLWNEDYMDELMVEVVGNFSHERIEHLKKVVHYLRPVNEKKPPKENSGSNDEKTLSYQEQKRKDQLEGNYRGAKIAAGAVVGAAVGGTVAYAAGVTVAGGVVAGAVIGGAAVYISIAEESQV